MPPPELAPIVVPAWQDLPWLLHGFSTRQGGVSTTYRVDGVTGDSGDLNLGFTATDHPEHVRENRERYIAHVTGEAHTPLVTLRQTHSAITHRVDGATAAALEGDGLMTDRAGVLLGIQTADCVPVLLVDPRLRAVAAFHAGWRGTMARIVEQGVLRMQAGLGSRAEDLRAAIGPAIGACCYTVGEEVLSAFTEAFTYAAELFTGVGGNEVRLDLAEANRRQLLAAGLAPDSITLTGACTHCDAHRFFSHRAQAGFTGRMLSVIGTRRLG